MSDDSSNLFNNYRAIDTHLTRRFGGNEAIGGYNLDMTISHWPISVRPTGSDDVFDYFLIQLQGKAHLISRGDFQVNAYAITFSLPQGSELVETSPDTSIASTSYTASTSTTVGGSIGFFGEEATGSISASETISHSTTQVVQDLRIMNQQDENRIVYLVARDSLLTQAETPLLCQLLVKRPHSSDALAISFDIRAAFTGGDRGDWISQQNWAGVDNFLCGFVYPAHPDRIPSFLKDSAAVDYNLALQLTAPPLPPAPK
jgi:hypothetical protein